MIKWDDLNKDQKKEIAVMAGFSEPTAAGLAQLSWNEMGGEIQNKLYCVNWFFILGMQAAKH